MARPPDGDRRGALGSGTQVVFALILAAAVVQFGMFVVLLAGKGEFRDFAAGYTAALVAGRGGPFYDPQPDHQWFGATQNPELLAAARQAGTLHQHPAFEHVHVFSYPPAMLFVFLPFTVLPFQAAKLIWLFLSLCMIGGALWLLIRELPFDRASVLGLLFLAAIFHPLRNTVDLGQVNALIFLGLAAFWVLHRRGRDAGAGVVLGLLAAVRFHPGLLVLFLLWRRQFLTAGVALAVAGVMSLVATAVFGMRDALVYLEQVAPKLTTPLISVENHSVAGFLSTLGHAWGWGAPDGVVGPAWLAWVSAVTVLGATLWILSRGRGSGSDGRLTDPELALILVAIPLATPNATINHLLMILPSIGILVDRMVKREQHRNILWPVVVGLAVILIGVVDDFYVHPALSRGPWILLAQIKFYGLAMLYTALARAVLETGKTQRG